MTFCIRDMLVVVATLGASSSVAAQTTLSDGFEGDVLHESRWLSEQIGLSGSSEPQQIFFQGEERRCGLQAAKIVMRPNEGPRSCNKNVPCERAEIRNHWSDWPQWGEPSWYGFSFKISGKMDSGASRRTVIAQWKAPGDNSPVLAQRYDNGVFHITVQSGTMRKTVACGIGNPEHKSALNLPASAYRVEFGCIQASGTRRTTLAVKRGVRPVLPDPSKDWVDMQIGVEGGHSRNRKGPSKKGRIQIWANGWHVATVSGDLGKPMKSMPPTLREYFKIGVYRDKGSANTIALYVDEFRHGRNRVDVLPSCAR